MTTPKTIAVAGTNELKVESAQLAGDRLAAILLDVAFLARKTKIPKTEVFEQPIGIEETLRGSERRAQAAKDADPEADFALGIENGILYATNGTWIDLAVICVIAKDGRRSYSTCPGIRVTSEDVGISIATRQMQTAGTFIGNRERCDPADWHAKFTGGLAPRKELLAQGIFLAFATLFNGR